MMEKNNLLDRARLVFAGHLASKGLKEETIKRKTLELRRFLEYIDKTLQKDLRDAAPDDIENYFINLEDQGFSKSTLVTAHSTVCDLFMALARHEMILTNPVEQTDICIRERSGVKVILTEKEMEVFLASIDTDTGFGLRDRALFELMYVTGMRIGEVVRLLVEHIDFSLNEVFIQKSKNRKDRIVPLGRVSKMFLERWVKKVRLYFLKEVKNDCGALFLSEKGRGLAASSIILPCFEFATIDVMR